MKITLDHNCIIDLVNKTDMGTKIKKIIGNKENECFVVNIGASEMWEKGVRPDHYDMFEKMLDSAGISKLPRLNPMWIIGVTFIGRGVIANDEMIRLGNEIKEILFGGALKIDIASVDPDSKLGKKFINRLCDVHTMWCHINYKNDIFLTNDRNFFKDTKMPRLITLGAGRICHPNMLQGIIGL
jgi:hypothetical protein